MTGPTTQAGRDLLGNPRSDYPETAWPLPYILAIEAEARAATGLREAMERIANQAEGWEGDEAMRGDLWNRLATIAINARAALAAVPPEPRGGEPMSDVLREALKDEVRKLASWTPEEWREHRGGDPIARTINAVFDIIDAALAAAPPEPRWPSRDELAEFVNGLCNERGQVHLTGDALVSALAALREGVERP